jgi:hypothetical protein
VGGVRKGSACPSGSGKPPAEGAVAFSSWPQGRVGSILCLLLFFEGERSRFSRPRQFLETAPIWLPCPSQYTSAFSAGVLPIRIGKASRRGRGGVFELATGVGRFHPLPPPFFRGGRYPDSAGQGSSWKRLRCGCLPPPNTPLRSLRSLRSLREFSPSGATELSLSANEIFGRARASERLGGGGGVDVL